MPDDTAGNVFPPAAMFPTSVQLFNKLSEARANALEQFYQLPALDHDAGSRNNLVLMRQISMPVDFAFSSTQQSQRFCRK